MEEFIRLVEAQVFERLKAELILRGREQREALVRAGIDLTADLTRPVPTFPRLEALLQVRAASLWRQQPAQLLPEPEPTETEPAAPEPSEEPEPKQPEPLTLPQSSAARSTAAPATDTQTESLAPQDDEPALMDWVHQQRQTQVSWQEIAKASAANGHALNEEALRSRYRRWREKNGQEGTDPTTPEASQTPTP